MPETNDCKLGKTVEIIESWQDMIDVNTFPESEQTASLFNETSLTQSPFSASSRSLFQSNISGFSAL
jgi:hypothetical protein